MSRGQLMTAANLCRVAVELVVETANLIVGFYSIDINVNRIR